MIGCAERYIGRFHTSICRWKPFLSHWTQTNLVKHPIWTTKLDYRWLRVKVKPSSAAQKIYNIENPIFSKSWPPLLQLGNPVTPYRCRETMKHLEILERNKLKASQKFEIPSVDLGDLVEVRYELSRTKNTFAVFQGYCVDIRRKGLYSSVTLKNTYDGVGVEQLFPLYNPRLLNMRVVHAVRKELRDPIAKCSRPITRDYRYKWHHNVRHRYERALGQHKPGIRSVEPKIRRRLQKLTRRYLRQRVEAGLPPYVWGGPYNILSRRRSRLIRAERYRRMLIYSWDEQRSRSEKLRRRRAKHRWGVYKIRPISGSPAISQLPSDHPLNHNLPK